MVFSSLNFIFVFLPALLAVYFLSLRFCPRLRNIVLLLASLFFYAWGGVAFLPVMLASIAINALFGFLVGRAGERERPRRAKAFMTAAVVLNLALLCYFKYTNFLVANINALFGLAVPDPGIVLPIGISFFTFQGMSYVLDVYMGRAEYERNVLNVALYVALFPQLIAGPIVRYSTVAEELRSRRENLTDFTDGIVRFGIGLGKKVILANGVGALVSKVFALPAGSVSVATAWLGGIAYTLQIYFDFAGYSDMAIGLGRMFGFHFQENFRYPCVARSISDYRRRWHISLSQWFRDYVYIPLGGNRCGLLKNLRNIFIVWLLTGVWHGAAWSYIAWGVYYALLLILEKLFLKKWIDKLWRPLQHVYTMVLVVIGYVIFRSSTLEYGLTMTGAMFGLTGQVFADVTALGFLHEYWVELCLAAVAALPVKDLVLRLVGRIRRQGLRDFAAVWGSAAWACGMIGLSVICLVGSGFNPFIYFQF